jgi:hypothetical protein
MRLGASSFVLRLDYFSCLLTVLSTVLVGRKSWTGLVVASINSTILCVIGFRTSQFGFIPANVFCIVVYAISIRSWIKPAALEPAARGTESKHFTGTAGALPSAASEG